MKDLPISVEVSAVVEVRRTLTIKLDKTHVERLREWARRHGYPAVPYDIVSDYLRGLIWDECDQVVEEQAGKHAMVLRLRPTGPSPVGYSCFADLVDDLLEGVEGGDG